MYCIYAVTYIKCVEYDVEHLQIIIKSNYIPRTMRERDCMSQGAHETLMDVLPFPFVQKKPRKKIGTGPNCF